MTNTIEHGPIRYDDQRECHFCGQRITRTRPFFYRVTVEAMHIDAAAAQRLQGTAQILGGSPQALAIAAAMTTPDAFVPGHARQTVICSLCFLSPDSRLADIIGA